MKGKEISFWRYIKSNKFNSILIKNCLLIILPTVIPLIIISIAIFNYSNATISEEIKSTNMNTLSKIKNTCDMIASESDRISAKIASDTDIALLLSYKQIVPSELYDKFNNLYKIMGFITSTNNVLDSVYIYFENSNFIFSTDGNSMDYDHFADTSWINDYNSFKDTKRYWVESRSVTNMFTNKTYKFISNFRTVSNYGQSGAVIVNIDTEKMKDVIDNLDEDKSSHNLLIVDKDGTILYNTDNTLITQNINNVQRFSNISFAQSQSYFVDDAAGNSQIVSVYISEYNDWTYISITPASNYSQRTRDFKHFMFIAVGACILIAILISFFISVRIYQPVINMVALFKSRNDWEGAVQTDGERGFNEFKYLTNNILNSFDKTKEMEKVLEERLSLLRTAQSIALQAQINPHFLYNTLETLNWKSMGLTGGENEVSTMIGNLSQLLRLSLETENNMVTIEMEIQHAKYYLDIQKTRYKDKFDIVWDIDPNIYSYAIVKLTLQPLVENAIYHGIKPKQGKSVLTIQGRKFDSFIEIIVLDNGVGMTREDVDALNAHLKVEYIRENTHIGLRNVNQRIKLVFGEEYGVYVESEYEKFTRVVLRIPKVI